jgi:hypothetical protein
LAKQLMAFGLKLRRGGGAGGGVPDRGRRVVAGGWRVSVVPAASATISAAIPTTAA